MKPYLLFFRLKASKFYERVNCRILILKAIETIVAKGVKISTDQFPPQKISTKKYTKNTQKYTKKQSFLRAFPKN